MDEHLFISYSRIDGSEFVLWLADALVAGPPSYRAWVDVRELQPGQADWDRQLVDAIKTCSALLFVMSEDGVRDESGSKLEWVAALKYKRPVIPVRVTFGVELPFRLGSRQWIDFSDSFDIGLAQLRGHLAWVETPEGVLQDLRNRLGDAEYELPRSGPGQRQRVEEEIGELRRQIAAQEGVMASPRAAAERATERIGAGLERERRPERPVIAPARAKFVNAAPMIAPTYFQDRHTESGLIAAFLRDSALRVMLVAGRGGVGKTAIVCRLLKALESGRLPEDLGELDVDGIVYLSPNGAHPVSFPNLFGDLCRVLAAEVAEPLLARYRDPHGTPAGLMRALLEAFADGRTVVLLDNLEDLVDAETFGLTDAALDEALRVVLTAPAHGVKVIITTRVAPRGLLLVAPGVLRRLDLDEGLESPFAEQVLRACDTDGRLGVADAPDALLARARERTRGFPRGLEALVAILAADRSTTLEELLADAEGVPENVIEALVGEAFSRLDSLSQRVMQAVAIYGLPVAPVAVDYLLQPFEPAIDSAPVLTRLVNMSFVRRDAGHYYVHQVDRDYALGRIAVGEPHDRDVEPLPFTQHGLRNRGADYFQQIRTPRETWRTLDDLAAQLAEIELRYQTSDYDGAAQVLLEIDFDYLILWGHYRLVIDMHERLQGRLTDRWTDFASRTSLGICYYMLGETRRAIELYEQALAIDREIGYRQGEANALGNLGLCYDELGETRRAIELYEQALAIDREIGYRQGEANALGNLGLCYDELGETRRAIELYEQALAIDQEIGYHQGEAIALGNLGNCYDDLGETRRAIELYEQALAIAREIGYRRGETLDLVNLGRRHADLEDWEHAARYCEQAIRIADETGLAQGRNEARVSLARVQLLTGELDTALATLQAADDEYPSTAAQLALIAGIARARQRDSTGAARAFTDAVRFATAQVEQTNDNYHALDTKALALCGLALVDGPDHLAEASAGFDAARRITRAAGIVQRVLGLFDALTPADPTGMLAPIRPIAAGDDS